MYCKSLKKCLTCFLCLQKCHVECANENKMKLNLYKQVNYKFYCYNCTNSVLPFQNVNNSDYDGFYESDKSSITKLDDELFRFI